MTFRYRKSINLGGGIRLNLSKTGVGVSAGIPGARYSLHSSGRSVRTVGVPGTGMYFRKDTYRPGSRAAGGSSSSTKSRPAPITPAVAMYPQAHLLAPKEEKLFVQGVTAYVKGEYEQALALFRDVSARDTAGHHVGEELFAGLCLVALQRLPEAVAPLETVLGSDMALPDALMQKYKIGGKIQVSLSPFTTVELPIGHVGAALMLAEVYEHTGSKDKGTDLVESLGSVNGDLTFALALAEMYGSQDRWNDLIRVTEGFTQNSDDLHLEVLIRRAMALQELGTYEAALTVLKEALRYRANRRPELLRLGHYVRGRTYESAGRVTPARKEYERVFAEDAEFMDVETRLEIEPAEP